MLYKKIDLINNLEFDDISDDEIIMETINSKEQKEYESD